MMKSERIRERNQTTSWGCANVQKVGRARLVKSKYLDFLIQPFFSKYTVSETFFLQLLQRSQELENGGAIPKINSGGMSPEKEFAKIAPVATSSPIATSNSQSFGIAPRAGSISGQFQQQPLHGAGPEDNLEELVRRAQNHPINAGNYDNGGVAMLENGHADNVPIGHHVTQPRLVDRERNILIFKKMGLDGRRWHVIP